MHKPRRILMILVLALALGSVLILSSWDSLVRLLRVYTIFDADHIVQNFRSMDQYFDVKIVKRSLKPSRLESEQRRLPPVYLFKGDAKRVDRFLAETWTTGLLVLKDDRIVHEAYYLGQKPDSHSISWSLAKSFVGTLVGVAHEEGAIRDLKDTMDTYVPAFKGSGYEGVPIEDVLEMSAPIAFDEDYANPLSDINRLSYVLALNGPIDDYMRKLARDSRRSPTFRYVSPNTQALAMVIRAATGRDFTAYFQEKIWDRLGTEADAYWIKDSRGVELVFGGLNATLRDYGRLGLLYLNRGRSNGQRIVAEDWIDRSVQPGKPYLQPKSLPTLASWGYGYHWWIPYGHEGDYCAIGIYHQYIYVNPRHRIVIVKTSADPHYNQNGGLKELETMAVFRAIARGLGAPLREMSRKE